MSSTCYERLARLALPELQLISLEEFEQTDVPLIAAKQNRSLIEYYFTCTPVLPLFIFKKAPSIDAITYLDSDLYFFADPELAHAEVGSHSIAISPHGFPPSLRHLERYGIFNVGWLTFRQDQNGLECLHWWRERCLEWCYDRSEPGRFADQKYLDDWAVRFQNVKVLDHPGINLAPWNLPARELSLDKKRVIVNGRPLIFYHFHNLKQISPHVYDPQVEDYSVKLSTILRRYIYRPYLRKLSNLTRRTKSYVPPKTSTRFSSLETVRPRGVELLRAIAKGKYLFVSGYVVI